ncbi:12723_t:CDS:2, partial [Gigaspora rosea]
TICICTSCNGRTEQSSKEFCSKGNLSRDGNANHIQELLFNHNIQKDKLHSHNVRQSTTAQIGTLFDIKRVLTQVAMLLIHNQRTKHSAKLSFDFVGALVGSASSLVLCHCGALVIWGRRYR